MHGRPPPQKADEALQYSREEVEVDEVEVAHHALVEGRPVDPNDTAEVLRANLEEVQNDLRRSARIGKR